MTTHEISTFIRGTAIGLIERFFTVDPLTATPVLTDPTDITVTVRDPEGVETTYTFGVDLNISNPAAGVYIASLDPQLPSGVYHCRWEGTGDVVAASEYDFQVIDSSVIDQDDPTVAVTGPTYPWISGQDAANCAQVDYGEASFLFDTVAVEASQALYEISGRQFPGRTIWTVRPCAQNCNHWGGPASLGFWPYFWTGTPWGAGFGGWWWTNEMGDKFGCSPMSKVRLAGYPVQKINEVLIGGEALPEFDPDTGARNWRLDKRRELIRMDTPPVAPSTTPTPRFWPGCQNLSLDSDQPGTFEITYEWGSDVPQIGKSAAVELANQLWLACGGGECVLPVGATRVVRQGIEIDRGILANWMDPTKPTGLVNLDTFLTAYWNGQRGGRRSSVWSPDQQQFARRVGQ